MHTVVNVGFGRPNVTVNEDDGQFMMCVTKDRVTLVDVIVTITTSPGTATEGVGKCIIARLKIMNSLGEKLDSEIPHFLWHSVE